MKIGIYNPYFDGLGGGERYCLTLASHWSKQHDVVVFWNDKKILQSAQKRFNLDLSRVTTAENIFAGRNLFKKIITSGQYDLIFFLSDGSIPTTFAKYNILHFQVPFTQVPVTTLKLKRFGAIVCNSHFTLDHLDSRLQSLARVIYPPVFPVEAQNLKKEHLILSVGRFTSYYHAKRQEILIATFAKAFREGRLSDWKLVLAGGFLETDRLYFRELQNKSRGLPVELIPNISFSDLASLYNRATFYWHAAGFGQHRPELMEHFGIATVEAMSAGCIPLVFSGGGQPEIVREGIDGFLWRDPDELIEKTSQLSLDNKLRNKLVSSAQKRAMTFDQRRFYKDFDKLLMQLTK